ncbi:MAG: hypothetical protein KGL35_26930 [Bradyrhizobium sp.]|nr:hypothetical protein [Bradyrhizobium sp.]
MLISEMTKDQHERAIRDWSEIAGEPVQVELVKGVLYAYGSELGMRRLAHKMRSFNVRYSENLGTWYFSNAR